MLSEKTMLRSCTVNPPGESGQNAKLRYLIIIAFAFVFVNVGQSRGLLKKERGRRPGAPECSLACGLCNHPDGRPLPIHQSSTGSGVALSANQTMKLIKISATTVATKISSTSHLLDVVAGGVLRVLLAVLRERLRACTVLASQAGDDRQDEDGGRHRVGRHPGDASEGGHHDGDHDDQEVTTWLIVAFIRQVVGDDAGRDEQGDTQEEFKHVLLLGEGFGEGQARIDFLSRTYYFDYSTSAMFCQCLGIVNTVDTG